MMRSERERFDALLERARLCASAPLRFHRVHLICARSLLAVGIAFVASLTGCGGGESVTQRVASEERGAARGAEPWFEDVAEAAGISFVHISGHAGRHYLPEIMSGGAALIDIDGDGWLDLYLVQAGGVLADPADLPPNRLYRNRGGGAPRGVPSSEYRVPSTGHWELGTRNSELPWASWGGFEDVTEGSGAEDRRYGVGVAVGDYNNNGFPDIYVTNLGRNTLLRSNGDFTFTDVTDEAGVGDEAWGASAAFLDANGNGWLDLFIVNYLRWSPERELNCTGGGGEPDYCSPVSYAAPAPDTLYHNNGDGRFTDVSMEAGLRRAFGTGLGLVTLDYNRNGRIDVFVANDKMPNQLWENQGPATEGETPHFRDVAMAAGCAIDRNGDAKAGMGVHAADLNGDGYEDIFVVNLQGESDSLYRNMGGYFIDDTIAAGLGAATRTFTRFGMAVLDFDNDGWLDLYHANGAVFVRSAGRRFSEEPYAEPNVLFRGDAGGRFEEVARPVRGATRKPIYATSRAAAFGDLNNDGGIDIIVVNRDGSANVLKNIVPDRGNWIMFRVLDEHGRDAYNARLMGEIEQSREEAVRTISREVRSAYSYLAANDPRVHIGLGEAERIANVTVRWPGGETQHFGEFDANQIVTLRRGNGRSQAAKEPQMNADIRR